MWFLNQEICLSDRSFQKFKELAFERPKGNILQNFYSGNISLWILPVFISQNSKQLNIENFEQEDTAQAAVKESHH